MVHPIIVGGYLGEPGDFNMQPCGKPRDLPLGETTNLSTPFQCVDLRKEAIGFGGALILVIPVLGLYYIYT